MGIAGRSPFRRWLRARLYRWWAGAAPGGALAVWICAHHALHRPAEPWGLRWTRVGAMAVAVWGMFVAVRPVARVRTRTSMVAGGCLMGLLSAPLTAALGAWMEWRLHGDQPLSSGGLAMHVLVHVGAAGLLLVALSVATHRRRPAPSPPSGS